MDVLTNFRRLADFSGREPRRTYWPFFAIILAIYFVLSLLCSLPMMAAMMTGMANQMSDPNFVNAVNSGDQAQMQAQMMPLIGSSLGPVLIGGAILWLLFVLLLAASTCRRLHDSGLPGYWMWLVVPFPAIGYVMAISAYLQGSPLTTMSPGRFGVTALNWIADIVLVVLPLRSSEPDANRYGEDPQAY